ncbi:hypothetical protein EB796_012092 [Bugula neritina]|uniref:Uncharacterized protein n=1 Tax=Bugula neritina TaxID=10212 RepID=A0A7J7JUG1_BUGNE|nr:hypothetical protein EB796_012092 [Bugula neritina]
MNMFWRVACFNIHESVLSSKSVYTTVRGNLQSDALKSNKKSRKGRKGSSSESTASNKVSGDLDGPRMAKFQDTKRAKARTTKTQPVDLDLDMDDVPLENIQG